MTARTFRSFHPRLELLFGSPAGLAAFRVVRHSHCHGLGDHWQGFTGITGVIRIGGATDAAGFLFPSNADEKRMQAGSFSRMKHGHGTAARRDYLTIGKADPLISVLIEELIADSPVA